MQVKSFKRLKPVILDFLNFLDEQGFEQDQLLEVGKFIREMTDAIIDERERDHHLQRGEKMLQDIIAPIPKPKKRKRK